MGKGVPSDHAGPLFRATIEVQAHAIKKNRRPIFRNQRTGIPFIGKSQRLRDAEDFLVQELRHRAITLGIHEPIRARVRALFLFGFPPNVYFTKQLKESKRLGDCTNLAEIVQDSLQKANIIENDSLLAPITIDRVCTEKTQITIELYE